MKKFLTKWYVTPDDYTILHHIVLGNLKSVIKTNYLTGRIYYGFDEEDLFVNYQTVSVSLFFSDTSQPSLYNAAAHKLHTHTVSQVMDIAMKVHEEFPINGILWKPRVTMTACKAWYYVNVILLHLVPGMLVDGLLKLSGKKPL